MDSLGIEHEEVDGRPHAWRIKLRGAIDIATAPKIDAVVESVIERGGRFIVLDLEGVDFLDSSGLRSIVRASEALAERDGQLTCRGLSGAAERVLELTGMLERLRDPDDVPSPTTD